MKLKLVIILYVFLAISPNEILAQNQQKKVLFIGNSMTFFNDMPILFRDIANSKGKNVITQMYAPGGTGFANHVFDANVYNFFKNNIWDAVILQPGTGESGGLSATVNTTIQNGKKLIDSIKKYSPCSKIMLYEISNGVASPTTYNNYYATQKVIKDSVTKMADNLYIPMVPAGESARMHYTAQQNLLLHGSYGDVHPNLNGSYLVAATMFVALFQEPVTGSTFFGGVPQVTAQYFHGIADQVVLPNKAQWRINTYNLHADFNYVINSSSVNFTNVSNNYTALQWDFGDGTTSNNQNPTHTYLSGGIKTVKLKAIKNQCEEIIEKQIDLGVLQIQDYEKKEISIYPNPTNSILNITDKIEFDIKIINLTGQEIYNNFNKKKNWQIDVSRYRNGVYFLIINNKRVYKFIKQGGIN